jgi:hypothetical protein
LNPLQQLDLFKPMMKDNGLCCSLCVCVCVCVCLKNEHFGSEFERLQAHTHTRSRHLSLEKADQLRADATFD